MIYDPADGLTLGSMEISVSRPTVRSDGSISSSIQNAACRLALALEWAVRTPRGHLIFIVSDSMRVVVVRAGICLRV
jgi:hypothetical protein